MALNTNRSSNIFTNPRIAQLDAQLWEQVTGQKRRIQTVSPPTSKVSPQLPTPKAKLPPTPKVSLPTPKVSPPTIATQRVKSVVPNLAQAIFPEPIDAATKAKIKSDLLFRLKIFAGK